MTANEAKAVVMILYTNYRGETSLRRIIPRGIRFAASEWHPAEQWIMDAFDIDKDAERSFAMRDILEWRCSLEEQPQVFGRGYRPELG